jgi:hypothetical protein
MERERVVDPKLLRLVEDCCSMDPDQQNLPGFGWKSTDAHHSCSAAPFNEIQILTTRELSFRHRTDKPFRAGVHAPFGRRNRRIPSETAQ